MTSTYRWQGEIERDSEWYCHLKTTSSCLRALQTRIRELHPYDLPEIIALPIQGGDPDYLKWIEDNVGGG